MDPVKNVIILFAVLCLLVPSLAAGPGSIEVIPRRMDLQGVSISQVLVLYRELTGATLYVDSRAKQSAARIVCKNEKDASKAEAIEMIQTALLEQAALVITRLDSNRSSVTFNDALPVKPVEKKNGS
jgi:type II secretory pathway component GspD/PulD (secretin)